MLSMWNLGLRFMSDTYDYYQALSFQHMGSGCDELKYGRIRQSQVVAIFYFVTQSNHQNQNSYFVTTQHQGRAQK
jgi:hypothetical protein